MSQNKLKKPARRWPLELERVKESGLSGLVIRLNLPVFKTGVDPFKGRWFYFGIASFEWFCGYGTNPEKGDKQDV